jgi:hypothetical protein
MLAVASLTLAALLWPLIPAVRAVVGLAVALGQWLPPCPRATRARSRSPMPPTAELLGPHLL